jgi:hypothetical protein
MWVVIGTLLGLFFGYYFSKKIAAIQAQYAEKLAAITARRVAGEKLRAAFTPEIAKYYLLFREGEFKRRGAIGDLLKDALPKHAAAIEEYRPFVPRESQRAYQEAWENYHTPSKNIEIDMAFLPYEDDPEFFEENIEAILKFAEPF